MCASEEGRKGDWGGDGSAGRSEARWPGAVLQAPLSGAGTPVALFPAVDSRTRASLACCKHTVLAVAPAATQDAFNLLPQTASSAAPMPGLLNAKLAAACSAANFKQPNNAGTALHVLLHSCPQLTPATDLFASSVCFLLSPLPVSQMSGPPPPSATSQQPASATPTGLGGQALASTYALFNPYAAGLRPAAPLRGAVLAPSAAAYHYALSLAKGPSRVQRSWASKTLSARARVQGELTSYLSSLPPALGKNWSTADPCDLICFMESAWLPHHAGSELPNGQGKLVSPTSVKGQGVG